MRDDHELWQALVKVVGSSTVTDAILKRDNDEYAIRELKATAAKRGAEATTKLPVVEIDGRLWRVDVVDTLGDPPSMMAANLLPYHGPALAATPLSEGEVEWRGRRWTIERTSHGDPWVNAAERRGSNPEPTDWLYRLVPSPPPGEPDEGER